MGANRLASNSLLECLVFGKRASEKAAQIKPQHCKMPAIKPFVLKSATDQTYLTMRNEMADLMMQNLGIVRERFTMKHAMQRFNEIENCYAIYKQDYNYFKIRNIAKICRLISHSALLREESRGGHIRDDFPSENPVFRKHIVQQENHQPMFIDVIDRNINLQLK
jgi:L-aspartate oxidase